MLVRSELYCWGSGDGNNRGCVRCDSKRSQVSQHVCFTDTIRPKLWFLCLTRLYSGLKFMFDDKNQQ